MRLLPLKVVAIAMVLACALAGCGGHGRPAAVGPLSSGSGIHDPIPSGSICIPGRGPRTFGDQVFTNYGHTAVVVERVVLLHPRNQRLVGSYAVPGEQVLGAVNWPPKYSGMPSTWKDRRPVHGFRLAPGKSFDMVLGVAAIVPGRSTSRGMLVYYHDSSGSYVAPNYFGNIIAANTHTC